jgi:hypothetical protein
VILTVLYFAGGIAPGHVHTRSHSFTPKLSSRLANLGGASPGRKGSADQVDLAVERDGRDGKEKEKRGVGFPFHFGGGKFSVLQKGNDLTDFAYSPI